MRSKFAGFLPFLILLFMVSQAWPAGLAPLPVTLPQPVPVPTPEELPAGPHIEPLSEKPPPPFLAPKGVVNVALKKSVTASTNLMSGQLAMLTDGEKESNPDHVIEMRKGLQWYQVDLANLYEIHAIVIWHDHRYIQAYRRVILQVADDADFTKNVRTLFNNDYENKAGLGVGTDREYFEQRWGRTISGKGERARYVRWYTNGSSLSALNNRMELEVYALPVK